LNLELRKSGKANREISPLPLILKIKEVLARVSPRKKLIVAVSGGADSVALLHLLIEAGYKNLVVAHFNHRLRGKASSADATFVRKLADQLNLPCEVGSDDVRKLASDRKSSLETTARESRYDFLAFVARKQRTRSLFLAHHADDQLETCFFNFLRGSGIAGLSGMKPLSVRSVGGIKIELHRPILGITKNELLDYLKVRRIRFREDATNAIADASRNKLRLKVLPLIEELFGSAFRATIVRNARIFSEEEELLSSISLPIAKNETLSVKLMRDLNPALRRRVLHAWLKNRGVDEPGFAEVERVASLLEPGAAAKVNLPADRHARRRGGILFIE
jgi:tRNA(Ile)-lysidine synthase